MGTTGVVLGMVGIVEGLNPQIACGTTELRYPDVAEWLRMARGGEIGDQGALAVDKGFESRRFSCVELEW